MKLLRILLPLALLLGATLFLIQKTPHMDAKSLAAEINKTTKFPKALGEGLRLDQVSDDRGALVYRFTMLKEARDHLDAPLYRALLAASKHDMCQFLTNPDTRKAIEKSRLEIMQNYYSSTGAFVLSARVGLEDCH